MVSQKKIFSQIKSLLDTQHFGVLATQDREYPYCTLVGYVTYQDCKEIIFATFRETRKYKNLKKKAAVSLLIDSQTNQANDFKEAQALTVLGTAREIDKESNDAYMTHYLTKHPYLKEFVNSPNCALIRVSVAKYILVNNFQDVMEYTIQ